jgi:hypothetical protein
MLMAETDFLQEVPLECPCCGSTIVDPASIRRPEIYALLKLPSEDAAFHELNNTCNLVLLAISVAEMETTENSPKFLDDLIQAKDALHGTLRFNRAMHEYRCAGTIAAHTKEQLSANSIRRIHQVLNALFNCTCDMDMSALEARTFRISANHYSVFLHAVIRECLRVVRRAHQYRFTVRYDVASDAVRAEAILEAEGEILLEPDYWNVLRIVASLEGASIQVIHDGSVRVRWTFPAQFGGDAT